MSRSKKILIILALVISTAVVSFGPNVYGAYENQARLERQIMWRYSEQGKRELSASEFARLYAEGQIADSAGILQALNEEQPDEETIKSAVLNVLEDFFASDQELFLRVKRATECPKEAYQKDEVLFMEENSPIALGFVTVNYESSELFLEVCYEEKTGVLVSMYYIEYHDIDEVVKGKAELLSAITSAAGHYYEKVLGLDSEQYYLVPAITNVEAYMSLGMKQGYEKEEMYN